MPSVETLEERWTPTAIQTAFVFDSLPSYPQKAGDISIDFPLLNLGWTFTLSLTPEKPHKIGLGKSRRARNWIPAAFSFRQHTSGIRWGNASIHAQLSLAVEQPHHVDSPAVVPQAAVPQLVIPQAVVPQVTVPKAAVPGDAVPQDPVPVVPVPREPVSQYAYDCSPATSTYAGEYAPQSNMGSSTTPLAAMKILLADTPSLELPFATSCTISSSGPNKIWLLVTISECPLPNGLFGARLDHVNGAQGKMQLVKPSNDRLLGQSIATGKLFDMKFLTPSTRSSGTTGKPLPTYASFSVLEEHVDPSCCTLGMDWLNALTAPGNTGAKHAEEISCPEDHKYDEQDSDFEGEDEDEASSLLSDSGGERDVAVPGGQQSGSSTERSSTSMSSYAVEGASDQGPVDYLHDGFIRDPEKTLSSSERTIWVKFAAHRTWHAFLWYCYTGNLEFCKLKSQVEPGGRHLRVTPLEGGPPACSPKSMYRLADLVGDKDLKAKALAAIKERLTEENVVDETFSVFTSRYPDVREVQLGVLKEHRGSAKVKKAFLNAMKEYARMPHAEPVLSAFYDNLVA